MKKVALALILILAACDNPPHFGPSGGDKKTEQKSYQEVISAIDAAIQSCKIAGVPVQKVDTDISSTGDMRSDIICAPKESSEKKERSVHYATGVLGSGGGGVACSRYHSDSNGNIECY
jgi:hypothetical protein